MDEKSIQTRLNQEQNPLIDGDTATFVWRGAYAPRLVGEFTGWEENNQIRLVRIGPRLWTYQLTLPTDAYIEYGFRRGKEIVDDPYNTRRTSNGFGGFNHYFEMPGYGPTRLTSRNSDIPHGKVTTYTIATKNIIAGSQRRIRLYHPPVADPVPLMVVWDGNDYIRRGHLNNTVDNLIFEGRINPIAIAYVDNGGNRLRALEYACNEASLFFLMSEILPLATNELNLIKIDENPGAFAILGASLGGLMAFYTGVRIPHIFGNILSQSGAFSLGDYKFVVFELLEHREKRDVKIWMDVGTFDDPDILSSNHTMQEMLNQCGYQFSFHQYNAGHNYHAWGNDIWRGLEFIYGCH